MKQQQKRYYINKSLRNTTVSNSNLHQLRKRKIAEETGNTENRTYAKATRVGRNPTRRLRKTNNADNKHKESIHEKLHSIRPTN